MADTVEEPWNAVEDAWHGEDENSDGEGGLKYPGRELVTWQNKAVYIQIRESGQPIFGTLSLREANQDSCAVFIVWQPTDNFSPASSKYAFSTPLSAVHSIRMVRPSLGTPQVMINMRSGITHLPLYFHSGRALEFQNKLQEYATLTRCEANPATMLVNDKSNILQRSLHGLDLVDATPTGSAHACRLASAAPPARHPDGLQPAEAGRRSVAETASGAVASTSTSGVGGMAAWESEGVGEGVGEGAGREWQWRYLQGGVCVIKSLRSGWTSASSLAAEAAHSAQHLLQQGADPNHPPLAHPEHARRSGPTARMASAAPDTAASNSTSNCSNKARDARPREDDDCVWVEREPLPWQTCGAVEAAEWRGMFDSAGVIKDMAAFRLRVYYGGLAPSVRREGWKWLLGCYPAKSTRKEREALAVAKQEEYVAYKRQWESITREQEARFAKFRDRRQRIDKDVVRTDRGQAMFAEEDGEGLRRLRAMLLTYAFYNFDLSYCQGMSDLAAPLLLVMKDEVEAFWCFQHLMQRMEANFHKDQNGMHRQLQMLHALCGQLDGELLAYLDSKDCSNFYFCFRWVLIQFKREFTPADTMRLWEACWAAKDPHLHLFVAIGILRKHKQRMMEEQMGFDEVLELVNGLALRIDCLEALQHADCLSQLARYQSLAT